MAITRVLPLTEARKPLPEALMRWASCLVTTGEIELMSTTVLPAVSPAATPFSPNSTFSTSGVSGNIRKTTSACRATAVALSQAMPPASSKAAGTWLRVFK